MSPRSKARSGKPETFSKTWLGSTISMDATLWCERHVPRVQRASTRPTRQRGHVDRRVALLVATSNLLHESTP